jgi:hypothetical protein
MKGIVHHIPDPLKHFGFLRELDPSGIARAPDYFFHKSQVIRDCIGRVCLQVGDIVEFELEIVRGKFRATGVTNLSAANIDPVTYQECSWIAKWDGKRGFLERDSGDQIALFALDILDFDAIAPNIHTGLWCWHGVGRRQFTNASKFFATGVQVYWPEASEVSIEEIFETAPELALAEPVRSSQPKLNLWTHEESRLPLREIIKRRSQPQKDGLLCT